VIGGIAPANFAWSMKKKFRSEEKLTPFWLKLVFAGSKQDDSIDFKGGNKHQAG
jgi:hypothetical protein